MRLALIIGRKKGAKHFEVLGGLDLPAREVAKGFRELKANPPPDLERIELWTSTRGRSRTHRFGAGGGINPDAFRTDAEPIEDEEDEETPVSSSATPPANPPVLTAPPVTAPITETVTTDPAPASDPTAPKGMQDVLLAGGDKNPPSTPDTTEGKKKK